jgi:PEGA domain
MSRLIVLAALGTALAGCSAIPGLPGSETKPQNISMQSTPPGAEVSFAGGTSCHTPCSLATPGNNGTYYAKFSLDGYQPTSIPVKVSTGKENWYSSEVTNIDPQTVTVKLEALASPKKNAPHHKKPATAQAKPAGAKPTTVAAAPIQGTTTVAAAPAQPAQPAPPGVPPTPSQNLAPWPASH